MVDTPIPPDEGDLLDEISEFREDFREYADRTRNREEIRRAESVHVLIALGVVGGYASFAATGRFPEVISDIVLQFFVVISLAFLFLKLATITLRIRRDSDRLNLLDETILPIGHSISLFGLLTLAIGSVAVRYVGFIQGDVLNFLFPVLGGFGFFLFILFVAAAGARNAVSQQEKLMKRFTGTLSILQESEFLSSEKSEELEDRLNQLIAHRDELRWLDYIGTLGDETPGELTRDDVNRVSNVLNRLEIKVKNNTIEDSDVERLDEIVSHFEER